MMRLAATLLIAVAAVPALAEEYTLHSWQKIRLTDQYFSEGASFGDFNHDGKRDLVCGPYWYAGPDFKQKHTIYPPKPYPNDRGYSNDNFFSFVSDFNGDGWDDVLNVGLPGTPANWYANPKGEGEWKKHFAFPVVDNEAASFEDITGDGKPELLCTFEGRLGYVTPNAEDPTREWTWNPISDKGPFGRFTHGLGIGDVDGDGRADYLMANGWWQQPPDAKSGEVWKQHNAKFCPGGAQLYAFDVDGDGDNDVVTSMRGHGYGLVWNEQTKAGDGSIQFKQHEIMGDKPEKNPYGVAFSQLHAIDCVDIDGDGRRDIVAGKCYWAHNGHDPGARDPAVLYWFRNTKTAGGVEFVPHLIDDDSGVGRQVRAGDLNGDGLIDVVTGNKKGAFLLLHAARKVSREQWEAAQPKRVAGGE